MGDAIQALQDIGYTGVLIDEKLLGEALTEGSKSINYTELVAYLTNELRALLKMDEQINTITSPEDSVSFLMEMSSFLKELGCPYESLTQGPISDRLADKEQCKVLLDYLTTELMAARMIQDTKPDDTVSLKIHESKEAADLKRILIKLGFPKPPDNISMHMLFSKLKAAIETEYKKHGGVSLVGRPIFNLTLTEKQWHILEQVQKELHVEYKIRREMLLKRLDCTIQSFQWSDKMKGKEEQITKAYSEKRKQMKVDPSVNMADLVSAREELAIIEKTSSASVRKHTKSSINRVIIGNVPDRGGRTNELAPPPPEMPSWQQRTPGPSGGRGGGGRGGRGNNRGGGGFNRGGGGSNYSQGGSDFNRSGSANYNRSGSDSNRGGSDFVGGGSNYNKGGSDFNRGGSSSYSRGGSDANRGSSDFGGGGSNYNKGGSDFSRGGSSNYSRGGSNGNRGSFDLGGGSNYNKGGSDFSREGSTGYSRSGSDFSRRSSDYGSGESDYNRQTSEYSRGGSNNQGSNNQGSNYSQGSNKSESYDNYGGGQSYKTYDSAGSYGVYQESKRPKTYDSFQNQKTTYADQYVQESQQNRQYQRGGNSRSGRGQSQYNRGGY